MGASEATGFATGDSDVDGRVGDVETGAIALTGGAGVLVEVPGGVFPFVLAGFVPAGTLLVMAGFAEFAGDAEGARAALGAPLADGRTLVAEVAEIAVEALAETTGGSTAVDPVAVDDPVAPAAVLVAEAEAPPGTSL